MRTYTIPTNQITAGVNDRTTFEPAALAALAENIRTNGLLQPIMLRKMGEHAYTIVLGERRYRACCLLGHTTIAAVVQTLTDEEASAGMLSENMARANLDPIDEANAYQARIDQFGWSVEELASIAGVSTVRVLFRLKLLKLRSDLQALVRSDNLSLGYAQILADADLDNNFQSIAVDRLRANGSPTPAWFRREVGGLVTSQNQATQFNVFDHPELYAQPAGDAPQFASWFTASPAVELAETIPMPGLTAAPAKGATPIEVMNHQITFWRTAGQAWDKLGKNFKRAECFAAANALESALALF